MTNSNSLDLNAMIKVAQAICNESELQPLLTMLMQTVMETAGTERGFLLLPGWEWVVKGVGRRNGDTVTIDILEETVPLNVTMPPDFGLSTAIVNWVIYTKRVLVLSEAYREPMFQGDSYINQYHPKSVLCIPLQKQGELMGIIYLENNSIVGAFTVESVQWLELLMTQVVVSLENAKLLAERQLFMPQLEKMSKWKSHFISILNYEVRTPVNTILGFSDLLLQDRDGDLPDLAKQYIQTIYRNGQNLVAMIRDIVDMARIEADLMHPELICFDVMEVIREVMPRATSWAQQKNITLRIQIPDNLPLIYADKLYFMRILSKVIANAINFTTQGEVILQAHISGNYLEIAVKDTALRITPAQQAVIFDGVHQTELSKAHSQSVTGLGLAHYERLVTMQGGQIWVESELGVGTTVKFTVKLNA